MTGDVEEISDCFKLVIIPSIISSHHLRMEMR